jgi:hypothetical protein
MQTAPEQQGAPFEARPVPLFRIDPGWPFVIAGLLLLVAGVLIPAQRDLHELRNSLAIHKAVEDRTVRQLAAYDRFLTDLDAAEPQLVNRLAASQLNLMPKDERSMLLVPTLNSTVTDWIEDSEPMVMPSTSAYPDTLLSRLATGPRRLWVLAAGAFLVFVGLMLSPSAPSAGRRARGPASPVPSHDPIAARGESGALAAAVPAAVAVAGAAAVDGSADIVANESALESAVAVSSHEVISEVPAVENVGAIESRIESSMTTVVPATIESSEDDSVAQHAAEVVEAIAAVEAPALASIESIEPAFVGAADAESLEESLEESLAEVAAVEAEAETETIVSGEAIVEVKPVIEHHVAAGIADEAESDLESELEQEAEHGAEHGAESSFGVELDGEVDVDAEIEDEIEAEMDSDSEVEVDAFARADHEESSARVDEADGAADEGVEIESIERADTPALPGELEHDADGEVDAVATATIEATIPEVTPVTPSANDRALDTWSLFEGLSPERGSGRR